MRRFRFNNRRNQRGLTLVELIVAFTIMLVLTTMSVPLARSKVRIMRERELRADLREMRQAIDKYKDYADLGYLGPQKLGTNNWPETLEILVEGVKLPGPDGKKMRFLRRIPPDPFTGIKGRFCICETVMLCTTSPLSVLSSDASAFTVTESEVAPTSIATSMGIAKSERGLSAGPVHRH